MTPEGRGVDVVMNHLAGPLLKATWECRAPFGRFLEIGKVDMEAARRLDMTPFTRCASIYGIDILQLGKHKGIQVHCALDDMGKAMRTMQGGTHMGKIVLAPRPDDLIKVVSRQQQLRFSGAHATEATYLVGSIGRTITIWLAERGARHVLLVSRNTETHVDAPQLRQEALDLGCHLQIQNCDVVDKSSLSALLKSCSGSMPPIKGVIHAAMLLQWRRVVSPKVAGAWNIHNCVKDLDFFVMLSSLVGVSGHMSQANYAAGNTFLDALARYRTARGLPGVSLDLGGVKSVGFVAESTDDVLGRVIQLGNPQPPPRPSVDDAQVVTSIDSWTNVESSSPIKRDPRFRALQAVARAAGSDGNKAQTQASGDILLTQALSAATVTMVQAAEAITVAITSKLAKIFNIDSTEIDGTLSMSHYGVDSLVAVELRNWLSSSVKAKLSIFEILQSTSLAAFGTMVATKSEFLTGVVA
ncbi:KR domain-containing protein [Nemania diffusa]|nr:KR domain-containing protein [Nemania diffusa]